MAAAPEHVPNVHGTAIAAGGKAALIRGPSGSGKSDLALRCLCLPLSELLPNPAHLIADDRVCLQRTGEQILLSPPPSIAGQMEVRGLGIVPVATQTNVPLVLVVDLVSAAQPRNRMPEPATVVIDGLAVPHITLHPFEASAPIKLLLALSLQR
jgi:HPr kinase/phosphorylase